MDPLTVVFSSVSLAVSIALAVREFSTRPVPLGWFEIAHQYQVDRWVVIGYKLNIANVGRRHFIVSGMGVQNVMKDGLSGVTGKFAWLPDEPPMENLDGPFSLAPGDVHLYLLPVGKRGDIGLPLVAQIVERNPWRYLPGRGPTRRKDLELSGPKPAETEAKTVDGV